MCEVVEPREDSWTEELTDAAYAGLKPGRQTYHYRYRMEFLGDTWPKDEVHTKPLAERVIEGTLPWTLVADDKPYAPRREGRRIFAHGDGNSIQVQVSRAAKDTSLVRITIQARKPPTGMAFDVSLRRAAARCRWGRSSLRTKGNGGISTSTCRRKSRAQSLCSSPVPKLRSN